MPNPFVGGDGLVKYDDATPATVDNYARDVTAFLAWTADPRLEERKRIGLLVMLYLLITAVLLYFAKRRIWAQGALTPVIPARGRPGSSDADSPQPLRRQLPTGTVACDPGREPGDARLTSPMRTPSAAGSCS